MGKIQTNAAITQVYNDMVERGKITLTPDMISYTDEFEDLFKNVLKSRVDISRNKLSIILINLRKDGKLTTPPLVPSVKSARKFRMMSGKLVINDVVMEIYNDLVDAAEITLNPDRINYTDEFEYLCKRVREQRISITRNELSIRLMNLRKNKKLKTPKPPKPSKQTSGPLFG